MFLKSISIISELGYGLQSSISLFSVAFGSFVVRRTVQCSSVRVAQRSEFKHSTSEVFGSVCFCSEVFGSVCFAAHRDQDIFQSTQPG